MYLFSQPSHPDQQQKMDWPFDFALDGLMDKATLITQSDRINKEDPAIQRWVFHSYVEKVRIYRDKVDIIQPHIRCLLP